MTSVIIISTIFLCTASVVFTVWSFIDTRRRYYNEYMSRKKK